MNFLQYGRTFREQPKQELEGEELHLVSRSIKQFGIYSILIGGETGCTMYAANNAFLNRDAVGRKYKLPSVESFKDKITFRKAGAGFRFIGTGATFSSYMMQPYVSNKLRAFGLDNLKAETFSVLGIATLMSPINSLAWVLYTDQMLTLSKGQNGFTVVPMKDVAMSFLKNKSRPVMATPLICIFSTALGLALFPTYEKFAEEEVVARKNKHIDQPLEAFIDQSVVPAIEKAQEINNTFAKSGYGFFPLVSRVAELCKQLETNLTSVNENEDQKRHLYNSHI